ncbi:hypothetical protein [Glycomyces arizonensis]|nr:hypothetical protein [Glycomyces arizonensis]
MDDPFGPDEIGGRIDDGGEVPGLVDLGHGGLDRQAGLPGALAEARDFY